MIPSMGIPILNKPHLLQRFFDSIDDGPIDRLLVIDNGSVIKGANLRWPTDVGSIHVTDPGYNMGVAGSWNHTIRANMNDPWWVLANNDMRLEAGALRALSDSMSGFNHDTEPVISRIQVGNESWGNHFGVFAVNAAAINQVGWFDENLYPIYFEDTDWMRRAERLDIRRILVPSKSHHDGNESWKGNPVLQAHNKRSWDGNVEYFDGKWKMIDVHAHPPNEWYPPTLQRLREQAWPVERKDSGPV